MNASSRVDTANHIQQAKFSHFAVCLMTCSPKCKKTFPSFFSILSWSLLRSSWYCCCLIFVTIYSASCEGKQCREVTFPASPDNQRAAL